MNDWPLLLLALLVILFALLVGSVGLGSYDVGLVRDEEPPRRSTDVRKDAR